MDDTIADISLSTLALFLDVAHWGNFSAISKRRGITRSVVSRTIARLERQLDTRLCHRTTRSVTLTEAGQELARQLETLYPHLIDALRDAGDHAERLHGPVRISMSHGFGRAFVLPVLAELARLHPGLQFALDMSDEIRDLVSDRVDFSVRLGPLPTSAMLARRIGTLPIVLAATPQLARKQTVHSQEHSHDDIEALAELPAVVFRIPATGEIVPWTFTGATSATASATASKATTNAEARTVRPRRIVASCDSIEGLADLVRLGVGVGLIPRYLIADELERGSLVAVTQAATSPGPDVHLCFMERRAMPRRVRLVIDELSERLRNHGGLALD